MTTKAVILMLLLLTCTFGSFTTVKAEPTLTPHEDPAAAQSTMDAYSFLQEYATIFTLMSTKQYENASRLSEQLSHITVPADLSYVINKYNELTQQLITTLNDLQTTLDTASHLLDQNRLNEAGQSLDHAGVLVAKAQILLGDLKNATTAVSQRLGIWAAPAESKAKEAYNQLQSMLQRLKDLIDLYHQLLQRAEQRAQDLKAQNLSSTTLSLSLNGTRCFVGSYLTVMGTLTSEGNALGSRTVKLFLDGTQVATATTDANGTYSATIKIPFRYVDSVLISTVYTPEGSDKTIYLAAVSPTVKVQVLYYKTILDLSVPNAAYPGLTLTVSGKVTAQDETALNNRQVKVLFDTTIKTQGATDRNGTFTAKFTIDAQAPLGKHSLTVTVEPKDSFAPASEQKTVDIQKIATQLQINAPQFILLPAQLQIIGNVEAASGPLKDATVQLEFTNLSATAKTLGDGSFNLTVNIPLNTALAGYQELTIKAQPAQPWQASAEVKDSVFTLNSVSTSVALASSLSVFAVTYLKFARTKKDKQMIFDNAAITSPMSSPTQKQETPITITSIPPNKFEGSRGKILKAYVEALTVVQTATGVILATNMTLREYAQSTNQKIGDAARAFTELTTLSEKSLYSPHEPQPEELQKAEDLAKTVRRMLSTATQ